MKMAAFENAVQHSQGGTGGGRDFVENSKLLLQTCRGTSEMKQLKMAVSELYLALALLQKYQELNYNGFYKITKRCDAFFTSQQGQEWRTEKLDTSQLNTDGNRCQQFMSKLETFMCHLEGEDKQKAMKRLKIPLLCTEQSVSPWTAFRIGMTFGLLVALIGLVIIQGEISIATLILQVPNWEHVRPLLRLYRGSFLLIEFFFLLAVNMYIWGKSGVNHVLVFELDPRHHLSCHHIFEVAGGLAVCCCTSLLACLQAPSHPIPQHLHPLLFHCFLLLLLLNPAPVCHHQARSWLATSLFKVITAPFHQVRFAHCWLADQLNSLSPLFQDLWDLMWFYACDVKFNNQQDPSLSAERMGCELYPRAVMCLIQCFPPWLRFAQCLRCFWDSGNSTHIFNAGKYSSVFIMVMFAGLYNMARENPSLGLQATLYLYLWAVATCFSVLVTVAWDLQMDWGLLQENRLLKAEMIYSRQVFYYSAMLADVLLRISWAINIILAQMKDSASAATASAILVPLEVLRRCIWNLFRLENEHLKNCEVGRAVRDVEVPVAPLNLLERFLLENMMEQEEPAKQHNKKMASSENSSLHAFARPSQAVTKVCVYAGFDDDDK
uniref:Uncharacterized protein n=1 Tax=Denticeps clupeoides TaxID=299321 RepID=A0AAY4EXS3_9TELE